MANIKAEWDALSADEQITFIKCCVRKSANRELDDPAQFIQNHGIEALVNDTWITIKERMTPEMLNAINAKRAKNGNGEISLTSLVYRAARSAILKAYRAESKNPSTTFEAVEAYTTGAENITSSVEIVSAIQTALTGRDSIDHLIISSIRQGLTLTEIAAAVGISVPAIHKRVTKLRAAIRKQIA